MAAGPYFDSGGFERDQGNRIGVYLVDVDGNPYTAAGGSGASVVDSQMQFREGAAWVNAPGTAARGLLVDPISGGTDGQVGLPARIGAVAGYDGANLRAIKTSAAGVLQVDVLSLPAGAATAANQATEIARLEAIRDRLPDVTATAAAAPTDEGMVVHVATQPAGGAAGTQYTEADTDATITGTAIMWEDGSDTLRAVSAAKPLPISDAGGSLTVDGSVAVTGSVTADTELTTADLDTAGGTDTRAVVGLVRAESGGATLVGSANPLPVTGPLTDTQLRATPVPVSGTVSVTEPVSIDDNAGSITVDSPQLPAALVGGRLDVVVGAAIPAGTNNIGDVDVLTVPADPFGLNADAAVAAGAVGSMQAKFRLMTSQLDAIKTGVELIDNTVAGAELQVDVLTLPGIVGNVAHDVADSGAPVKVGGRARTADYAAATADDRTDMLTTLLGKMVVQPYALPGATVQGTGNKTDATDLALLAAPGAGIRNYVTHITITNAHATVGTKIVLKSNATIIWRGYADAVGGGVGVSLPTPLRCAANEALNGACITTGADVDFTVVGYTAAE